MTLNEPFFAACRSSASIQSPFCQSTSDGFCAAGQRRQYFQPPQNHDKRQDIFYKRRKSGKTTSRSGCLGQAQAGVGYIARNRAERRNKVYSRHGNNQRKQHNGKQKPNAMTNTEETILSSMTFPPAFITVTWLGERELVAFFLKKAIITCQRKILIEPVVEPVQPPCRNKMKKRRQPCTPLDKII